MKPTWLPALTIAALLSVGRASSQTPTAPPDVFFAQAGPPDVDPGRLAEQTERIRVDTDRLHEQVAKNEAALAKAYGEGWFKFSDGAAASLYVPASAVDDKTQAEIEEDLSIMGRLLEKAAADADDDNNNTRQAMGIAIRALPFGGASRNLQIEGYGALFEVNVPFPLQPPAGETRADKPKEGASAWEVARQEVYGHDRAEGGMPPDVFHVRPGVEYNAGRVEELKDRLFKALANASNLRHLQAKDMVTVVVHGGDAGPQVFTFHTAGGGGGGSAGYRVVKSIEESGKEKPKPARAGVAGRVGGKPGSGSTLTLRVKKSDVDALAKGELKPDEFRKRALVVVY